MIDLILFVNKRKGQAAMMDSLFFLTIIVTLCVMLFKFSATYGDRIDLATSNLYFKEYSNSVLRTVFYSEIPLDFSLDINSAKEIDYLMIAVKEDFFSDGKIGNSDINDLQLIPGDIAKFNLYHTIKATMHPMPNYDYVFYLHNDSDLKFSFFLIKITNFEQQGAIQQGYRVQYIMNSEEPYGYYLCNPFEYADVRNLVSQANKVTSSSTPLRFYVGATEKQLTATFAIWPATTAIQDANLTTSAMSCEKISDEVV